MSVLSNSTRTSHFFDEVLGFPGGVDGRSLLLLTALSFLQLVFALCGCVDVSSLERCGHMLPQTPVSQKNNQHVFNVYKVLMKDI